MKKCARKSKQQILGLMKKEGKLIKKYLIQINKL